MQKNHHMRNRAVRHGLVFLFAAVIGLSVSTPAKAGPSLVGQDLTATSQQDRSDVNNGTQQIRDESRRKEEAARHKQQQQEIATVASTVRSNHLVMASNSSAPHQAGPSDDDGTCVSQPGALVTWCLPIHVRNLSPRVSGMNVECAAADNRTIWQGGSTVFSLYSDSPVVAHARTSVSFSNFDPHQTRNYNHKIVLTSKRKAKGKATDWECEVSFICGSKNCSQAEGLGADYWVKKGTFK